MRLRRRDLLRAAGHGITALMLPPALLRTARAETSTNVLVVAFLRGGADGLSLAIPDADPHYASIRPHIAIDATDSLEVRSRYAMQGNRAAGMDGFFRLSPEWSALQRRFESGELAIVHGVGATGSYSHFVAMDGMEKADPDHAAATGGWLHRSLAQLGAPSAISGVSLSRLPIASMAGADHSIYLCIPSLASLALRQPSLGDRRRILQSMYAPERLPVWNGAAKHALELIGDSTAGLFSVLDAFEGRGFDRADASLAGTPYEAVEEKGWARTLRDAAALIKAGGGDLRVRAIALDLGGWDHHEALLSRIGGRARALSQVLDAFLVDLGSDANRTLLLAMTEFGRTAFENGSRGTDHGFGTLMLVLGGAGSRLLGARVLSRADADASAAIGWPGLGPGSLHPGQPPKYNSAIASEIVAEYAPYERDLAVTIDFRDVLADVLQGHLGLAPSQISGGPDAALLGYVPEPLPDGGLFATIEA